MINNLAQTNVVQEILKSKSRYPKQSQGLAFAPSNIALCKYWGKRDAILNLPETSSLSISLGNKGCQTKIALIDSDEDKISCNQEMMSRDSSFSKRLSGFLDLFRVDNCRYQVDTNLNLPLSAGVASSACGFAALVQALDILYAWHLSKAELSILARLGSGSACRSLWQGFVEWQKGDKLDGMDSHGLSLKTVWPELRVGLLILNSHQKHLSSREAMEKTRSSSPFYGLWAKTLDHDLHRLKEAILHQNFKGLAEIAEANAQALHALMMTARPSIRYSSPTTVAMIDKIWQCRKEGLEVYFTQDAGPNLKLLFLAKDQHAVRAQFPSLEVISPWSVTSESLV